MILRNLSGIVDGSGFLAKDGRRVGLNDCGFVPGPVDLAFDDAGRVVEHASDAGASIDATGLVAVPAYIDPHTHPLFAGERSAEYFQRWAGQSYVEIAQAGGGIHSTVRATIAADEQELRELLLTRLRAMRRCGAGTVEVKTGYGKSAADELRLLRVVRSVRGEGGIPRLRVSFLGLHALPKDRDEAGYVDEMIGALPSVASEKLADFGDSFPERGFFSLESAGRFSRACIGHELGVKVHADELCDLGTSEAFIRMGALSIDHLQHINDRAVELLAKSPTVATMLPATSFFVGIPYADARRLIDAGAKVALATDFNPGTAPAHDLQLTHLLAAGQMKLTPAEILCGSTVNAAAALGIDPARATLRPGSDSPVNLFASGVLKTIDDAAGFLARVILHRITPVRVWPD
jgi:imidazolonepropionase